MKRKYQGRGLRGVKGIPTKTAKWTAKPKQKGRKNDEALFQLESTCEPRRPTDRTDAAGGTGKADPRARDQSAGGR
ncbi:hypothetical protein F183_A37480 [Bryobacterales bacterium F-183]|nr:hypothetical protein F183_A37480 [Bryobacterales bacterium F-183]